MNTIQLVGLALFAFLITVNVSRMIRRRSVPRSSLAWLCIWSSGIVALLFPDQMTRIARILGVNRGADLLLYVSVLSGLLIAFVIYTRMRTTDRQITLIVRQLALTSAELPTDFFAGGGDPYEAYDVEDPFFADSSANSSSNANSNARRAPDQASASGGEYER
jgi:hypothetical protein